MSALLAAASALVAVVLAATPGPAQASDPTGQAKLLERIRAGGVVLMMRHARTDPGIGDPPGFDPAVCATQRNLSAEGRADARKSGAWLREAGIRPSRVASSAWCRCVDTATLAFGNVELDASLDSFFGDREREPAQSRALRDRLERLDPRRIEVWVTHQVNITALTGVHPAMGEIVVLDRGPAVRLLGRIPAGAASP